MLERSSHSKAEVGLPVLQPDRPRVWPGGDPSARCSLSSAKAACRSTSTFIASSSSHICMAREPQRLGRLYSVRLAKSLSRVRGNFSMDPPDLCRGWTEPEIRAAVRGSNARQRDFLDLLARNRRVET